MFDWSFEILLNIVTDNNLVLNAMNDFENPDFFGWWTNLYRGYKKMNLINLISNIMFKNFLRQFKTKKA